jgi:chromate transport protein ChrA
VNPPSLFELVRYFLMLVATAFGGPVALANYMRVLLAPLVLKKALDQAYVLAGAALGVALRH